MAVVEDLTPGARVAGVLPDRPVTVVQAEWHGTQALTLTYRDDHGRLDHELLYRANEPAAARGEQTDRERPVQSQPRRRRRRRAAFALKWDGFRAIVSTEDGLPGPQ